MKSHKKYTFRRLARDLREGDFIKVGGTLYEIQSVHKYVGKIDRLAIQCKLWNVPEEHFALIVPDSMFFAIYFRNIQRKEK